MSFDEVSLFAYDASRKIICEIHFCTSLYEKAGVFYCKIRICSEILWIRQFYLLKDYQKTHQMPPNCTKISKFSRGSISPPPPKQGFAPVVLGFAPLAFAHLVLGNGELKTLTWLHEKKKICKIHVCMSLRKKKTGVFSYNIKICSEILCIRKFYLVSKIPKQMDQMPPNCTKISKFSRVGSMPPDPLARLCICRAHLRTFRAQKWFTDMDFISTPRLSSLIL